MKILHYVGFFGPLILFITTILLLRNKPVYLFNYCIGMLFNSIFNYLLKGFIQEPRPSEDVHIFNMELNSKKLKLYRSKISGNFYYILKISPSGSLT